MLAALALLGLMVSHRAHSLSNLPQPAPNDIVCPNHYTPTFVHNSFTYLAPLHKFTNLTKSFFDISWYLGIVVTNHTGTDNVPGATRSGPYGGITYNETLTAYYTRPDAQIFSYHGLGGAFAQMPSSKGPPVTLSGYTETMRFLSICGGQATYIDVLTYECSLNNQIGAYDSWYNVHTLAFPQMAASLGVSVMAGDCPAH
ncbi:hypothetical protein B0H14DRAFT_2715476 [Mycena olivaceomarginata]|nr:hypothetical protein B0H14DRAFT_2715476 [Mycena olivaceomarginata]